MSGIARAAAQQQQRLTDHMLASDIIISKASSTAKQCHKIGCEHFTGMHTEGSQLTLTARTRAKHVLASAGHAGAMQTACWSQHQDGALLSQSAITRDAPVSAQSKHKKLRTFGAAPGAYRRQISRHLVTKPAIYGMPH